MNLWFTEKQTETLKLGCKVKEVLLNKKSPYQDIIVLKTPAFGNMLVLDGYIQTSERDEFIYHEMIVHPALCTHPDPKKVLIIGGGDGGTVRETIKHKSVLKVVLVEIDKEVVDASLSHLPSISGAINHEKVELIIGDGIKYLPEQENAFDIIIIDSTEPVGPSAALFKKEFYETASRALKHDGILVAQTESPFYNADIITSSFNSFSENFSVASLYLAPVPTYPGGLWSFTMGSKKYHFGENAAVERAKSVADCRYYSPEIHRSAFVLPPFVKKLLK